MAAKGNNSAKIENMLNLALDTTEQEREKSISLSVGYDDKTRTWEVVVKFFRDSRTTAGAVKGGAGTGGRTDRDL